MRLIRRSKRGTLAVLIMVVIVSIFAGLPWLIASNDARRPPSAEVLTRLDLPPSIGLSSLKEVRIDEVIDGDTIAVFLDGIRTTVRYYGVDTPERNERCYREAVDRNEHLAGARVLLLPDARELDPGGRTLRYVFTPEGISIDATLVAEGFGNAWRADGRYRDRLAGLESEAEEAQRGCLWKPGS